MLVDEYKKYLVNGIISPLLSGRTPEQQVSIIRRVTQALHGTERITAKLYPSSDG